MLWNSALSKILICATADEHDNTPVSADGILSYENTLQSDMLSYPPDSGYHPALLSAALQSSTVNLRATEKLLGISIDTINYFE